MESWREIREYFDMESDEAIICVIEDLERALEKASRFEYEVVEIRSRLLLSDEGMAYKSSEQREAYVNRELIRERAWLPYKDARDRVDVLRLTLSALGG